MNIFLDIETIPNQQSNALADILAAVQANFKAPSGMTKDEFAKDLQITNAADIKFTPATTLKERWEREMVQIKSPEIADQQYRKTALNGGYGEIYCIGYAIDDGEPKIAKGATEAETLQQFFDDLADTTPRFIGHNLTAFDLRFLWQRAVVNRVKPPFYLLYSPYSDRVFDTMTAWAGHGNRISFDELCKILNVPTPKSEELDGSKVWDFVQTGRGKEVQEYCLRDVVAAREVYNRLTFQI